MTSRTAQNPEEGEKTILLKRRVTFNPLKKPSHCGGGCFIHFNDDELNLNYDVQTGKWHRRTDGAHERCWLESMCWSLVVTCQELASPLPALSAPTGWGQWESECRGVQALGSSQTPGLPGGGRCTRSPFWPHGFCPSVSLLRMAT